MHLLFITLLSPQQVQHLLRKRQYNFNKAKEANRKAQSQIAKNAEKAKSAEKNPAATNDTAGGDEVKVTTSKEPTTETTTATGQTTDTVTPSSEDSQSQEQAVAVEKDAKISASLSSPQHTPALAENGEKCVSESGGKSISEGHCLGPVSEEDLIKPTEGERRKKTVRVTFALCFSYLVFPQLEKELVTSLFMASVFLFHLISNYGCLIDTHAKNFVSYF